MIAMMKSITGSKNKTEVVDETPVKYNTPYTHREDEIILEEVLNTSKITDGFKNAADRLPGRTEKAISVHFYTNLRKKNKSLLSEVSTTRSSNNGSDKRNATVTIPVTLSFAKEVVSQLTTEERRELFVSYIQ